MREVFRHIHEQLSEEQKWVAPGGGPGSSIIKPYHGALDSETSLALPSAFTKASSVVRCLVTTVAFGMGVHITDVQYVIHYGPPASPLAYMQEIGRCARDGRKGQALMYLPSGSVSKTLCSEDMIAIVKSSAEQCIRNALLSQLKVTGISNLDINKVCGHATCCSYCATTYPK